VRRSEFRKLIGPLPDRGPPNKQVLSKKQCDGYTLFEIEYDVEPGERIRAYLLKPLNFTNRLPAIFCHHQHASNFELGKSEPAGLEGDPDQAIAPELARRGYVVLVPDAIAFEDRNWSYPTGRAEYHELVSRLVQGKTLIAKVLGDVSAGIDLLTDSECVDENCIGFIGHSYGGRMAIWAPANDDRIRASVSNCGCVNFKDSLPKEVGVQAEFCVPGILEQGDIEDIVKLISPRALYISATDDDKWSQGAQAIYDYAVGEFPLGHLKLKIWQGKHIFNASMREAAYTFLDKYILHE